MSNQFHNSKWQSAIDVRDFIYTNHTPFDGSPEFLTQPTKRTLQLWNHCKKLLKKERDAGGVLAIDTNTISSITSHKPGYINKKLELIVGLQTDKPLKRAIKPLGGIRVVEKACIEHNQTVNPKISQIFSLYRKTHNDGVFDAYTSEMRLCRSTGLLTGLPDNYARGRIIGDYRRVALYGVTKLIEAKQQDLVNVDGPMTDEIIRLREEINEQIRALKSMAEMASSYGFDISKPAVNAREAVQWTYFAYLAALKEHDGAAMSLGQVSTFFDIFIESDIKNNILTESEAQELVDQFVIKLRLVRHLRMSEYDKLFAGDPTWLTESLGGMWMDGNHKVTKTSYRFLQTLYNLGPSPEPNLTILWSEKLPPSFKRFCAKVSIDTSSIQFENDDLMRSISCADDYGISCCVSQMKLGTQMQYFGARCNVAKTLLLAINGGYDEITGKKILNNIPRLSNEILDYNEVLELFHKTMTDVVRMYVNTMNVIHYMHDKYYYERAQMSLIDTQPERVMAFGVAGLSVVADSLSAIKHAKVRVIRNEQGIATKFEVSGDFPKYGNDDDRVDQLAQDTVAFFHQELKKHHIYKNATPTLSVLTITSNVVYGKKTGATPDGRLAGQPFAPGANPMHGRDTSGAIASLNSVAKISYDDCRDGISNTFTIVPHALGADDSEQQENLVSLLDGYFTQKAHHLNVNVLRRETMLHAMDHPEEYPQLTIRVSGYAVHFIKLSREQQQEVLARTFFESL